MASSGSDKEKEAIRSRIASSCVRVRGLGFKIEEHQMALIGLVDLAESKNREGIRKAIQGLCDACREVTNASNILESIVGDEFKDIDDEDPM